MRPSLYLAALVLLAMIAACSGPARRGPVVFAASSLQEPLEALGERWVAQGGDPPVFSFASSAALARQIEQGAPADLFISADEQWTDYIVAAGRLPREAMRPIAANSLVVAKSIREGSLGPTGRAAGIECFIDRAQHRERRSGNRPAGPLCAPIVARCRPVGGGASPMDRRPLIRQRPEARPVGRSGDRRSLCERRRPA